VNQSLLYNVHSEAGAALRPQEEASPLLTYGAVPEEYAAANEGAVLFDRTDRGLVVLTGKDAADVLHRILANTIKDLEPGDGNRNLLLTGKGKIRFDFDLRRESDGFRLSTIPGGAAGLLQALDMFVFAEDVQMTDATESHAPLFIGGPKAAELLTSMGLSTPKKDQKTLQSELDGTVVRVTQHAPFGVLGFSVDGGPELASSLWSRMVEAGARPSGRVVSDILRVEACVALPGHDIDENIYPQEARLEEAFNLSKGCYIGQEVVAKIDTYGGLNKRLCALKVTHDDPVARGSKLSRWSEEKGEWRDLGIVTSWAYSFKQDTGQILAYIKRRHQEPGTVFRIDEGPAKATLLD
jgi:folate-binding protein YgfZ